MYPSKIERMLLDVQKPGRYVGGELGAVVKNRNDVDVRFAFCFPDIYEIGMSHLGMKILYGEINETPYFWCERVFAPWVDMEEVHVKEKIPLYALESGDSVKDFDVVGFTLQYELSYTNVLNMLKLSGIPLRSSERTELKNLVVAGGPCACNPEPLAEFIDLIFLGDGEEICTQMLELYRKYKKEQRTKDEFLFAAAGLEGVYVPSLYEAEYNSDGTIKGYTSKNGAPKTVRKHIVADINKSFFPKSFIVPMIDIVHNRAITEVLRGCIRGCRFCQAGFIYRPYREKAISKIDAQCKEICESTGYNEISLSSLSTNDHSELLELLDMLGEWTKEEKTSISLPSLRLDSFSPELMGKINSVRKSGLTFAPEAGSQRLRNVINKNVKEEDLINAAKIAFSNGWTKLKLYFMIGLPTETMEDISAIIRMGQTAIDIYYENKNTPKGKPVSVTLSAAAFVPKPFTPFQWFGQDTMDTLKQKQIHLKSAISSKKMTVNYHEGKTSFLEAVFARGDRRLARVLERAIDKNMRFDGWESCFDFEKWMECFEECGIDPSFYANRSRDFDEVFPWDHLDFGVSKEFLIKECKRAYEEQTSRNCREECSACGVSCFEGGICVGDR